MPRIASPFTVFPLKTKKSTKPIYYVYFRMRDGSRVKRCSGQTAKSAAERWAREQIEAGKSTLSADTTFKDIATDFFTDITKYRNPKDIEPSSRQRKDKQNLTDEHLIKFFGNLPVSEITTDDVEKFKVHMEQKETRIGTYHSPSSINKCLSCLRAILNYADDRGLLIRLPKIYPKTQKPRTPRGALLPDQAKKLFTEVWPDLRVMYANQLAMITGLRQEELLALQYDDILSPEDFGDDLIKRPRIYSMYREKLFGTKPEVHLLAIYKVWNQSEREIVFKTKTRVDRFIPIPEEMVAKLEGLKQLRDKIQPNSPYIFFADRVEEKPIERELLLLGLKDRTKEALKISDENWSELNIDFHSWRHFFNSFLANHVSDILTKMVLGHSVQSISDNYMKSMDFEKIVKLQKLLL
jgi:integrase